MLSIYCPHCKEHRPEIEFANAGQAHIVRPKDMNKMSDDDFYEMFFIRENPKGFNFERWRHSFGCGKFFNAVRNTITDKFITTYKIGEPKPSIEKLEAKAQQAKAQQDIENEK